jgi:hypothetical protein
VNNDLCAVAFDPVKLEIKGGSIPVVEGVLRAGGAPQYAVSDSGTLIYMHRYIDQTRSKIAFENPGKLT